MLNRSRETAMVIQVVGWIASLPLYPTPLNLLQSVLPRLG